MASWPGHSEWVIDEAEQECKVESLSLGHIVDIDGDGLPHDRTEERRPGHEASSVAERHRHQFCSLECLGAAGYLQGPARWRGGEVGAGPEALGCQHVDAHSAALVSVGDALR